jgi:protein-tyrosine kinase
VDKRTHLIERAAARLGSVAPTAAIPLVKREPEPSRFTANLAPRPATTNDAEATRQSPITNDLLGQAGLILEGTATRAAEEFRIVQSKITRKSFGEKPNFPANSPNNVVMFTSALQGEGKSFCAINLAAEIARQGDHQVILIDADPKPNGLGEILGVAGAAGLLDLARDKRLDPAALARPTEIANLAVLPYGTNGQGSAELFASRRMAEAIDDLSRRNQETLILVDAPPCLASSTPHRLAALVGQGVLVVAAGSTQDTDVEAALELLEPCPHVSLLLNKVPAWLAHSFGSYAYSPTEA